MTPHHSANPYESPQKNSLDSADASRPHGLKLLWGIGLGAAIGGAYFLNPTGFQHSRLALVCGAAVLISLLRRSQKSLADPEYSDSRRVYHGSFLLGIIALYACPATLVVWTLVISQIIFLLITFQPDWRRRRRIHSLAQSEEPVSALEDARDELESLELLHQLTFAYCNREQFEEAVAVGLEAEANYLHRKDQLSYRLVQANLAFSLQQIGRLPEAEIRFQNLLGTELEFPLNCVVLMNYAQLLYDDKRLAESLDHFAEAQSLADHIEFLPEPQHSELKERMARVAERILPKLD